MRITSSGLFILDHGSGRCEGWRTRRGRMGWALCVPELSLGGGTAVRGGPRCWNSGRRWEEERGRWQLGGSVFNVGCRCGEL